MGRGDFKNIARRQKNLSRMANQAKLRSFRTAPEYKYGYEVPRNYNHAKRLHLVNDNTKWRNCTNLEMAQLDEHDTFIDSGEDRKPPGGCKRINVHLIFDIKNDGRHKARCVADGHLTDIQVDTFYSGVVSLRGLRIMLLLAELNKLDI